MWLADIVDDVLMDYICLKKGTNTKNWGIHIYIYIYSSFFIKNFDKKVIHLCCIRLIKKFFTVIFIIIYVYNTGFFKNWIINYN